MIYIRYIIYACIIYMMIYTYDIYMNIYMIIYIICLCSVKVLFYRCLCTTYFRLSLLAWMGATNRKCCLDWQLIARCFCSKTGFISTALVPSIISPIITARWVLVIPLASFVCEFWIIFQCKVSVRKWDSCLLVSVSAALHTNYIVVEW